MIEALLMAAGVAWALAHLCLIVPRLSEPQSATHKTPYSALVNTGAVIAVSILAVLALSAMFQVDVAERPLWWVLGSSVLVLVWVDLRTTYLPKRLMLICGVQLAAALALAVTLGLPGGAALRAAGGATISAAFYWLIWRLSRGGIGFGDVRLAPAIGLVTAAGSWTTWWVSLLAGSIIGVVWGLVATRSRRGAFAYAPSMLLGAYVALLIA